MGMAEELQDNATYVHPAGEYMDIKVIYLMKIIYGNLDGLRFQPEFEQLVGALRENDANEVRFHLRHTAGGERELEIFGVRTSHYNVGFLETGFGAARQRIPAEDGREYAEWEKLTSVFFPA